MCSVQRRIDAGGRSGGRSVRRSVRRSVGRSVRNRCVSLLSRQPARSRPGGPERPARSPQPARSHRRRRATRAAAATAGTVILACFATRPARRSRRSRTPSGATTIAELTPHEARIADQAVAAVGRHLAPLADVLFATCRSGSHDQSQRQSENDQSERRQHVKPSWKIHIRPVNTLRPRSSTPRPRIAGACLA
jgi:hypothetical protein